ncbi:9979_t:CDS:2 [Gigaspora margarita]|uniref:9979_t:CDS:1 n=1 Tax=Gigaspora margarita TaxID=4874 RepID=A0ABM8VZ92_GIGMA|nr:9979_t:CDS:2 [Gigaspora margarita]
MPKGWAFPANAKFGKKGRGKKIKKSKDKLTAQEMHLELKKFAQSGEIDDEDISQVSMIHN